MTQWILKTEEANILLMCQILDIPDIMAQVMVNRNIRTKNTAIKFLDPQLKYLRDACQMKDMEKAVNIIIEKISLKEKFVVYGDYDVDGVTSTVILFKALKKIGADVSYYIPQREEEGYGLNITAVRNLREAETDVLITLDNGIASLTEIMEAKNLGMTVIILDHHEPGFVMDELGHIDVLPIADAVVDPKQASCPYEFKALCAGGLAYKMAVELFSKTNTAFDEEDEFLTLAMIATFCDIVDLQDENRIIANNGLKILNENRNINLGLKALIEAKSYENKEIDGFAVGFIMGPCINASGRLAHANVAVELFTTECEQRAKELAEKLTQLNETRKSLTLKAVEQVVDEIEKDGYNNDPVIVVYNKDIHESIAGIVAGRVKDNFYRPTIVITKGEEGAKGSARSIEGYNMFEELFKLRHLFSRFGGHPMAAGLSLEEENIQILRQKLMENCTLKDEDFAEKIFIDKEISLDFVTYELAQNLSRLAPFGKGNKEPLFLTRGLKLDQLKIIEDKNTIIFTFLVPDSYRRIKALCFGMVDKLKNSLSQLYDDYEVKKIFAGILRNANFNVDIVYYIDINEYNGNISVQMKIKDFAIC